MDGLISVVVAWQKYNPVFLGNIVTLSSQTSISELSIPLFSGASDASTKNIHKHLQMCEDLQMFWKYLRELFSGWKVLMTGTGLILSVIGFFDPRKPHLPVWVYFVVAACFFVCSSFSIWKKERLKVVEAESRQFEILFEDTASYRSVYYATGSMSGVPIRTFKVAVKNTGSRTIEDVNLNVIKIEPIPANIVLPLPLHVQHAPMPLQGQVVMRKTNLNPNSICFFEVLQMPENGIGWIEIYTTAAANRQIQRGCYSITLQADGKDVKSAEAVFNVYVDHGELKVRRC